MPIIRGNPQKNYKLINEFGLNYTEDVLDISDPTSGIFDDEIKGEAINILKEQIEVKNLHIGKGIRVAGDYSEIFATCVVGVDRYQHQGKGIRVFRYYVMSRADRNW